MARAFLTPPTLPTTTRCRVLEIPDSPEWLGLVGGALVELLHEENWERFGAITPQQAAQAAQDIIHSYYGSERCMSVGMMSAFCVRSTPPGWLPCFGGHYLRADYPALYDVLPDELRDGATGFWTPNLADKFILATGATHGQFVTGGSETVTLTTNQIPAHTHAEGIASPTLITIGAGAPTASAIPAVGATGSAGGGASHDNMPPFQAFNYYIRAV